MRRTLLLSLTLLALVAALVAAARTYLSGARRGSAAAPTATATLTPTPAARLFDGAAAYAQVQAQVEIGPRPTGSEAGERTGDYIIEQLTAAGWQVEVQEFTYMEVTCRNIVGKAGSGPVAIIGAHYDTRRLADNDPDPAKRSEPVLGANDGASGVAVLLELARSLEVGSLSNEVWLAFFDAEDNGRLDGWEFIAGSTYMANNLTVTPAFVIVLDMIGDADQQIYKEYSSTPELQDRVWAIAKGLGYEQWFIARPRWSMLDDHTPFLRRGIPALEVIDFDYPYWHTTEDITDKVSADALERVGRVVEKLLED